MIDGSSTVPLNVFDDMKAYVLHEIKNYDLSKSKVRFAVSVLGDSEQYTSLSAGTSEDEIIKSLRGLSKLGGSRRIDTTLRKISNVMNGNELRYSGKLVVFLLNGPNDAGGVTDMKAAASTLIGNFFYCIL